MRTFEIKPEHLKLLSKASVRWEDCEFGAPAIDCKRPYGNSGVVSDIFEILEIKPASSCRNCGDDFSREQEETATLLHKQTEIALQIILATQKFETGVYKEVDYKTWQKVQP